MVDTYTKVILTVIALSLSTIAFKGMFVTTANAELEPYNLSYIESSLEDILTQAQRIKNNTDWIGGNTSEIARNTSYCQC